MTRLEKLLRKWGVSTPVAKLLGTPQRICVDIGSRWTKVLIDGKYIIEPTCLLRHDSSGAVVAIGEKATQLYVASSQNCTLIYPVQLGKVVQTEMLSEYVRILLDQHMYKGLNAFFVPPKILVSCLYAELPAQVKTYTQVLLGLSRRVTLLPLAEVLWRKAQQVRAQKLQSALDMARISCVIDVGACTTKFFVYAADTCVALHVIEKGSEDLIKMAQDTVRIRYHCEVSLGAVEVCLQHIQKTHVCTIHGKNVNTNLPMIAELEVNLLQRPLQIFLEMIGQGFTELCQKIAPEFVADIGRSTIYLSGGGSQLPSFGQAFGQLVKLPVVQSDQPQRDSVQSMWQHI